jgi:hypothetical protein
MLEKQHVSGAWGEAQRSKSKLHAAILIALRNLELAFFAQKLGESD